MNSKGVFSPLGAVITAFTATVAYATPQPGYQSYNGFTNDVGPDIATVIEYDDAKDACDQYQADLDQYLIDNDAVLSQLDDTETSIAVLSEHEQYIVDNFVDTYDRETLLLCGKHMFFYGTFDTTGVPQGMVNWLLRYYEDYFGPGFENFGMYEDPNPVATIPPSSFNPALGSRQLPVGFAASSGDFADGIPVYAFSCAACHFKQQDDGNFAVGIGNTDFDYARMTLAQGQIPYAFLFQSPDLLTPDDSFSVLLDAFVIEDVQDELAPYITDARNTPGAIDEWFAFDAEMNANSTPEDRQSIASTLDEQRQNWATWSGVMDFMVRPMQDDGVFTITRILNLNHAVTDEVVQRQHGFPYQAGLGWHGGSYDLVNFVRSFITITPSDIDFPESRPEYNYWVNEYRYMPLVRYVETFQEPALPTDRVFDLDAAARGEAIFDSDCTSCHNGPGGETSRSYDHGELNVESGHAEFMDLYWDETLYDGAGGWETNVDPIRERFPAGETGTYTKQVKSPRFISMWDNERLLHNGSVRGLDELLSCTVNRTDYSTQPDLPFSNQGHQFGCELDADEKSDLKTFIETFRTTRNVLNRYNGQFDSACLPKHNGGSQIITLEFIEGRRMDLFVKHYSDAACQDFDITLVKNPSFGLSWDMYLENTFINSRGYESHTVLYIKPDGTWETGVIALEDGQLANATEGDPEPRGLFIRPRTDYPGLNGLWLNEECTADNTRGMLVIRDGVRVDKTVTYNGPDCTGGVQSLYNDGAWTFDDPKWLPAGIRPLSTAKYNMRMRMKSLVGAGNWTQFLNRYGDRLSAMFNNNFAASINGNGEHYTRIRNINTAE